MPRILTNKKNLPLPLYLAIKNDTYESRGDISTTSLIDAPFQRILKKYNTYEEDASELLWALDGQSTHAILERVGNSFEGNRFLAEQKLMIKTTGNIFTSEIELSGTSDLIEITSEGKVILHDYKKIFVYTAQKGVASEAYKKWILQLNIYKLMIKENLNLDVEEIFVHAFIRDWKRSKSEWSQNYPEYPMETFSIPAYSNKSMLEYIKKRIDIHFPQDKLYSTGHSSECDACSEEDRWSRPEVWKMLKLGGKRSLKNFIIKDDADRVNAKSYFEMKSKEIPTLTIEQIPGEDVRCLNYCPVNKFCKFYKNKYGSENKTPDGAGVIELGLTEEVSKSDEGSNKPASGFTLKFG